MSVYHKLSNYLHEANALEAEFSKLLDDYANISEDIALLENCDEAEDKISGSSINIETLKKKKGDIKAKILAKIRKLRE